MMYNTCARLTHGHTTVPEGRAYNKSVQNLIKVQFERNVATHRYNEVDDTLDNL